MRDASSGAHVLDIRVEEMDPAKITAQDAGLRPGDWSPKREVKECPESKQLRDSWGSFLAELIEVGRAWYLENVDDWGRREQVCRGKVDVFHSSVGYWRLPSGILHCFEKSFVDD